MGLDLNTHWHSIDFYTVLIKFADSFVTSSSSPLCNLYTWNKEC